MAKTPRLVLIGLACLALTACGGGGGGGGGTNTPPTAAISASPSCGQAAVPVSFSAAGSNDPDGSITSYSWNFGDNTTATGAQVTHAFASAGTFRVTLTVTDNRGAQGAASIDVTTISGPLPSSVAVSGTVSFERVPFSGTLGSGLDYTRTFEAPAREVEVELLRASDQSVLQTTVTNTNGQYQFAAPLNTDVRVRAKALSRPGAPMPQGATWNVRVLNNTNSKALYVLDGSTFNTCVVNHTRNLKATTGWGGGFSGVYTGVRAAAPFALLDTLYSAVRFVIEQGDGGVQLPSLDAYWSEKNVPADGDFARGEIGTTAYYPAGTPGIAPGIYVLGAASNDTDEFDQHVVAHEFLHYLEDAVSRADTVGGDHSLDELLDMRVAFSEGFGNAFCAMVLGDPLYRDSFDVAQGKDFHFSVESGVLVAPGWYSERSIHSILWDLFDSAPDGVDGVTLGFGPLYDVFRSELRTGVPLSSLFPFITALKQRAGVPATQVDGIVEAQSISDDLGIVSGVNPPAMDAYASTETHSGGSNSSLPVYAPIAIGGSQTVCADTESGTYNALGNRRFLRFTAPARQTISVRAECIATASSVCGGAPAPDPDFVVSRASTRWVAEGEGTVETLPGLTVEPGDYVIEVYEYSHVDLAPANGRRGRTCMRVTINTSG